MLCRDGNVLINFHEMNAPDIVRKLYLVEQEPLKVWKALESHYGYGFFYKVILEEFGIMPDFVEKMKKNFSDELLKVKNDAKIKLSWVTKDT